MLWLLALVPLIAGAVMGVGPRSRGLLGLAAAGALVATLLLALLASAHGWTGTMDWSAHLHLSAALTLHSAVVAMLVPFIALAVMIYAAAHEERGGLRRLMAMMLVFVGGMELLVIADDFLTLLIGWEIVGACSWALIGHDWRDRDNPASGLYAFLTTRLGDLGLFLAAMALFAATGTFAFDVLSSLSSPYLEIVAAGVLVSAAAKSGQLPFAPWLFRAMAGPTSVSALLHAATMVAAGAYLVIRLAPLLHGAAGFSETLLLIGLVTALVGGLVGLLQHHAKKLLAASTSAHFGLMLVAVGAGYPGVALLHLVAHAGFKALLFLCAGIAGERADGFGLSRLGFGRALPAVAGLSAVGALALAGIPPLGGAWTKEAIISSSAQVGLWPLAGVILAGGLSAAYAARFQLLAYGRSGDLAAAAAPARGEYAGLGLLALFTLALSVLWLPGVRTAIADVLDLRLPHASLAETLASMVVVASGLVVGVLLARRSPRLGTQPPSQIAADWLGLPSLIRACITRPFVRLAQFAADSDDRLVDGGIRLTAALGTWLARLTAGSDDRLVDGGIRLTAALGTWLARSTDRFGERIADGIPEGSAWLVGVSGSRARRLQSGLSHHYYALLSFGAALIVLVLLLGS